MNRNTKNVFALILIGFSIFLLPTALNYYFVGKRTDTYYKRVDEDFNKCMKNTNEDSREIRLCEEIKRSSELAFKSATQVSESNFDITFTQMMLFALATFLFILKGRIEDLEKKSVENE